MLLLFAARRPIGQKARLWETPLEVRWCLVGLAALASNSAGGRASTWVGCGRVPLRARRIHALEAMPHQGRGWDEPGHDDMDGSVPMVAGVTGAPEAARKQLPGLRISLWNREP